MGYAIANPSYSVLSLPNLIIYSNSRNYEAHPDPLKSPFPSYPLTTSFLTFLKYQGEESRKQGKGGIR